MNPRYVTFRKFFPIAVFLLCVVTAASAQEKIGWIRMGSAHVDGRNDHDRIKVGASQGAFSVLRLRVNGTGVKFDHIIVHYEDGQSETIFTRFLVANNFNSPPIHLRGGRRQIDSVELWYERGNWGNKPEVTLMGLR